MSLSHVVPEVAESYLVESARYINQRFDAMQQMAFEVGMKLKEVKSRLPKRTFMQWVETSLCFGISTVEKLIQAFENIPELAQSALVGRRALYLLAQDDTPEEARALALEKVQQGEPLDFKEAYVLTKAPAPICERMLAKDITPKVAFELTKSLESAPAPVQSLVLDTHVSTPETVHYLKRAYQKHEQAEPAKKADTAWQEITQHKAFLIDGNAVPIEKANPTDLDLYNRERQLAHMEAKQAKRQYLAQGAEAELINGEMVIDLASLSKGATLPKRAKVKVTIWVEVQS